MNLCRGLECAEDDPPRYPCHGYDCIESVPDAFEHRVFEPGEVIDWWDGIFFLNVATGRTEGYWIKDRYQSDHLQHVDSYDGTWIRLRGNVRSNGRHWSLVLHRPTGQAWRWAQEAEYPLASADRDYIAILLNDELQLGYPECETRSGVPCDHRSIADAPDPPECPGGVSPDGRYVAQQWGEPAYVKRHGHPYHPLQTDPSVVIVDATTCDPLFRVAGVYAWEMGWRGRWLSNSEGFVVGVEGGYAVARVDPPEVVPLPPVPPPHEWYVPPKPVPAPTGNGCYFAWDTEGVYDACTDRWTLSGLRGRGASVSWGETHEELRYELGDESEAPILWSTYPPRIEYPPFPELAFRVTGTAPCLDLLDAPNVDAQVLDCLPLETRVIAVVPPIEEASCRMDYSCLPAITGWDPPAWAYVRVAAGLQGWVAYMTDDPDNPDADGYPTVTVHLAPDPRSAGETLAD